MNDLDRAMDQAIKKDDAADAKLDAARWVGGPRICRQANLPSFSSEAAALAWHHRPNKGNLLYEANPVTEMWQCDYCHLWHFKTKPRPPSGASSGSGRQS